MQLDKKKELKSICFGKKETKLTLFEDDKKLSS